MAEEELVGGLRVQAGVQRVLHDGQALLDVLGEDLVHHLAVHALVFHGHLAGNPHADDGLLAAAARAAGLVEDDVLPPGGLDVLDELVQHIHGPGGVLAGGGPDLDHDLAGIAAFGEGLLGPATQGLVELGHRVRHGGSEKTGGGSRDGNPPAGG